MVAGTARLLDAAGVASGSAPDELGRAGRGRPRRGRLLDALAGWRFTGDVDGYPEGELYFPGSPVLTVTGTFAEAVLLETLVLSVLNHDCAVASAAARMVTAAGDRPLIEMGSRRTHEEAAVAAARAAYLAGFSSTSNLEAGRRYGIPTTGTAAHAFTLLHDSEADAFRAQVEALGVGTTLLVDTYDIAAGHPHRGRGGRPGAGRGPDRLRRPRPCWPARPASSSTRSARPGRGSCCPATWTSGPSPGSPRRPVDAYGVGTSVVTGSGAPTAGMVYKLVEVDGPAGGQAVGAQGDRTAAGRPRCAGTGRPAPRPRRCSSPAARPELGEHDRLLQVPLMRAASGSTTAAGWREAARASCAGRCGPCRGRA